jgi:hypothetical protein
MMAKEPKELKGSSFFKDGRIGAASALSEKHLVVFGGSSPTTDYGDFLILPVAHLKNEVNFSEIT